MQEQVNKLQKQVDDLTKKLEELTMSQSQEFKGTLDDVQVERVLTAILTGTPTTNTVLRDIAISAAGTDTGTATEIAISVAVPVSVPAAGSLPAVVNATGTGTITALDYPDRFMIYTWKGQRLAIPVYNASDILYQ